MQVSQIAELDTHVVIGGGKAQAFQITNSAEFFTLLSDTLYRDKTLAVVREVLCNAWDAHIAAGKTDVSVEVTLNDDELSFRDFGSGIDPKKIVPIYCIYGGSTKAKDHLQTGGFGLGSKAPFAYSDHFTVTSCCEGNRIVYAISRGGFETDGRPDIRQMVKVPTDESGLTVTIPLKSKEDQNTFASLVRTIAFNGGMKVSLNGEQLATLDYTVARERGYCVVPIIQPKLYRTSVSIELLYGTVIYPITTEDADVMALADRIKQLGDHSQRYILVAEPNTIGVTPSRESLSYSEMTLKTVKKLLRRLYHDLMAVMPAAEKEIWLRKVDLTKPYDLKVRRQAIKPMLEVTSDPMQIALLILDDKYDGDYGYRPNVLRAAATKNRSMRKFYLREALTYQDHRRYCHSNYRHASRLFVRMASKLGLLGNLRYWVVNKYSRLPGASEHVDIRDISKKLFIGPNQHSIAVAAKGDLAGFGMALVIPQLSNELLDKITALCTHYGIEVVNVKRVKREKPVVTEEAANKYHNLWSSKKPGEYCWYSYFPDEPVLENPKIFYFLHNNDHSPATWFKPNWDTVRRLYPEIAFVRNPTEANRLVRAGAMPVEKLLLERIDALKKNKAFLYAYTLRSGSFVNGSRRFHHGAYNNAHRLVMRDRKFAKLFFNSRYLNNPNMNEYCDLADVLKGLRYRSYKFGKLEFAFSELFNAVEENAAKAFKDKIVDPIKFEKNFAYLSLFMIDSAFMEKGAEAAFRLISSVGKKFGKEITNTVYHKEEFQK